MKRYFLREVSFLFLSEVCKGVYECGVSLKRSVFYIYEQGEKEIQEVVLFDIIKRFGYN